jgi:hypothetical protein
MRINSITFTAVCLCLAAILGPSTGNAGQVSVYRPSEVAIIGPPAIGEMPRLIVSFDLSGLSKGRRVDFAWLSFASNTDNARHSGLGRFVAYPLERGWDADLVDWTEPWTAPGGDFDPQLGYNGRADGASGSVSVVDLTLLVGDWVGGERLNHGIVLVPSEVEPINLGDVRAESIELRVWHHRSRD